jgi:hypothetical protein
MVLINTCFYEYHIILYNAIIDTNDPAMEERSKELSEQEALEAYEKAYRKYWDKSFNESSDYAKQLMREFNEEKEKKQNGKSSSAPGDSNFNNYNSIQLITSRYDLTSRQGGSKHNEINYRERPQSAFVGSSSNSSKVKDRLFMKISNGSSNNDNGGNNNDNSQSNQNNNHNNHENNGGNAANESNGFVKPDLRRANSEDNVVTLNKYLPIHCRKDLQQYYRIKHNEKGSEGRQDDSMQDTIGSYNNLSTTIITDNMLANKNSVEDGPVAVIGRTNMNYRASEGWSKALRKWD